MTSILVRGVQASDLVEIQLLWGTNVLDELEILSYDRWGPGIAVPVSTDVAEARVVTDDPGDGLPKLLDYLITADDAFGLVAVEKAESEQPEVIGYVMCSIRDQGVNDFRYGEITELYVREDRRRRGVGRLLVETAIGRLRDAGALQFKVEVPKTWREGIAFWATQRFWEQDCVVYSLYD